MNSLSKVLYVTHYLGLYGANRSLLALLECRQKSGAVSHVCVFGEGELTDELKRIKVGYTVFSYATCFHFFSSRKNFLLVALRWSLNKIQAIENLRLNRRAARQIACLITTEGFEVVHSNSIMTQVGHWAAERASVPHVWHLREFGDLDYFSKPDWGKKVLCRWLEKATRLVCISESIRHYHCEHSTHAVVIPNGVLTRSQAERVKFNPSKHFTCLIMGYLSETKGQHEAIEAVAQLNKNGANIKLNIVGDGDSAYTERLRQNIEQHGQSESIRLLGKVDNPLDYFQRSEVTLMCSRNEGMGRVSAEAMFCGSVVVGYDNAGTSELIQHQSNGLLYQGGVGPLAECIDQLYREPVVLEKLRREGRIYAESHFLVEKYGAGVEALYEDCRKENESDVR